MNVAEAKAPCKVCCDHDLQPEDTRPMLRCIKCDALRDPFRPGAVFSKEEWASVTAAFGGVGFDCCGKVKT